MRELLLIAVVCLLCCIALVRPRIGVYGYVWYAVMRPDVLAWCPDEYNFSMMLAVATLIGAIPHIGELGALVRNPVSRWFLILQGPLLASTVFAVVPALSYDRYIEYLKSMAVLLLIPVFVRTANHLKQLILILAVSLGVIGFKFGMYGIVHGGDIFIQGYGGQMSDNNLVALALAMGVPLCWYGLSLLTSRAAKLGLACLMVTSMAAIPMTNSRGASLALGLALVLISLRSKRRLGTLFIVGIILGGAVYLVRDQYMARMSTLSNYKDEASANSRVEFAEAAFKMWQDYPALGVGFGGLNYVRLVSKYLGRDEVHVVHNTYLQMLVDSGPAALLIYVGLLVVTAFRLPSWGGYGSGGPPHLRKMALALQASLAAFILGGTFYSSQRYDLPYILMMTAGAYYLIANETEQPLSVPPEEDSESVGAPAVSLQNQVAGI